MRIRRITILSFLVSCGTAADFEQSSGQTYDLNGQVLWIGDACEPHKDKILRAFGMAKETLASSSLRETMSVATLTYSDRAWGEQVIAEVAQDMPTHVECKRLSALGEADVGLDYEALRLGLDFLESSSEPYIAGVVVHEVAHNKGYSHPTTDNNNAGGLLYGSTLEYPRCVSEQLENALTSIIEHPTQFFVPAGGSRILAVQGVASLTPVGGFGGGPFELSCGPGFGARGILVRSGSLIDAIGLLCGDADSTLTRETALAGGTGGEASTLDCGAGNFVVGVEGNARNLVEKLTPICADSLGWNGRHWKGSTAGSGNGVAFRRLCPERTAVRSIRGRSGASVDRIEIECTSPSSTDFRRESLLTRYGKESGTVTDDRCPGRSTLTGLTLQTGAAIDRLGGACTPVATDCSTSPCNSMLRPNDDVAPILVAHGGFGGSVAEESCPADMALVGLQLRSRDNERINSIGGICADVRAWSLATDWSVNTVNLPMFGDNNADYTTRNCQPGAFLVGWRLTVDTLINSIEPVCRRF